MQEEIDNLNVEYIERLTKAYIRTMERLQGDIDSLLELIGQKGMTKGRFVRLERYHRLQIRILEEMEKYSSIIHNELQDALDASLKKALKDSVELIKTAMLDEGYTITGEFTTLQIEQIKIMLGFLSEDGPLFQRIYLLAPYMAQKISETMIEGIALGYNPRKIARLLTKDFGLALTDALRLVRTAQIWAYREANRATYIANDDVVEAWIWYSALMPGRTCMSCVAMHGSVHPLSEPLDDHYNGHCTDLPLVIGATNDIMSGEEWFNGQSEAVQRRMMGPAKFEEWTKGNITISQMTEQVLDPVYGTMRKETALKTILEQEGIFGGN